MSHYKNKLSRVQVAELRVAYHNDEPLRDIARRFGVNATTVRYWAKADHDPPEWVGADQPSAVSTPRSE